MSVSNTIYVLFVNCKIIIYVISHCPNTSTVLTYGYSVCILTNMLRTYIINSHKMGFWAICRVATHASDTSWRCADGQMEPLPLHNSFAVQSTYAANQIHFFQNNTDHNVYACIMYRIGSFHIIFASAVYMHILVRSWKKHVQENTSIQSRHFIEIRIIISAKSNSIWKVLIFCNMFSRVCNHKFVNFTLNQ